MLSKPKSRKASLDKSDMRHAVECCLTQRCSCHPCTLFYRWCRGVIVVRTKGRMVNERYGDISPTTPHFKSEQKLR